MALFHSVLTILGLLLLHGNFKLISIPINNFWDFYWNHSESIDQVWKNWHLDDIKSYPWTQKISPFILFIRDLQFFLYRFCTYLIRFIPISFIWGYYVLFPFFLVSIARVLRVLLIFFKRAFVCIDFLYWFFPPTFISFFCNSCYFFLSPPLGSNFLFFFRFHKFQTQIIGFRHFCYFNVCM